MTDVAARSPCCAAVYRGPGDVALESIEVGSPGPGEVLLRVAFCGVCGSDVSEYAKGPLLAHIDATPHPITGHSGPVALGHELSGYVLDAGEGVSFAVGTLVACAGGVACGTCRLCVAGRGNLCERYHIVGYQRDGGLAELCVVPARACTDAGRFAVTPSTAALAQPMGIAVHALRRARLHPGARVAIVGVGGIGAFLLYAAVEQGLDVAAVDIDRARLELAGRLGAAATWAPSQIVADEQFEAVFEVSGTESGLDTALALAGRGGRLILVGAHGPERTLSPRRILFEELEITGTVSLDPRTDLPEALRVLATRAQGWGDIAPRAFPLQLIIDEGLSAQSAGRRIKTLFAPGIDEPLDTADADAAVAGLTAS